MDRQGIFQSDEEVGKRSRLLSRPIFALAQIADLQKFDVHVSRLPDLSEIVYHS